MNKVSIEDIAVQGKKVLVRVDFNVPMDKETGEITDDNRITAALPTIKYLYEHGAKVILCSHLGRPKGEFNMEFSMAPVAKRLGELVDTNVILAKDVVGEDAQQKAAALKDGEILLLENVRFHAEEEKNDPAFAKQLADLAEIYVNDAFGTAHRAHASTAGVAAYLPTACGYLIEKEVSVMGKALENPDRPFVAILGGAKVKDKIGVINNLLEKVDTLIIGGGMAYTFLAAKGYEIGQSLLDEERIGFAKAADGQGRGGKRCKLLLPVDTVVAKEFEANAELKLSTAPTALPRTGRAWTLDPRPETVCMTPSKARAPSFGTARWACLSLRPLPPAPRRLRLLWPSARA